MLLTADDLAYLSTMVALTVILVTEFARIWKAAQSLSSDVFAAKRMKRTW